MKGDDEKRSAPKPEQMAAYVDGELNEADCAEVESWLAICPSAAAEVESLRRLADLFHQTTAPVPSSAVFRETLAGIHVRLPKTLPPPRSNWRHFAPVAGAAAAILITVLLGRTFWPTKPATLKGPLHLVDTRDIDIVSMDLNDTGNLLVGGPLLTEPLKLARPGEITLISEEPSDCAECVESKSKIHRESKEAPLMPPFQKDAP